MKSAVQLALRGYKRWISPMMPASCKYTPTCSEYAMEAVERYGVLRGGLMSAWRLLRCNPFAKGGYDPVTGHDPVIGYESVVGHESVSGHESETGNESVTGHGPATEFCHPERSEGSMHSPAVARCIGASLRSG